MGGQPGVDIGPVRALEPEGLVVLFLGLTAPLIPPRIQLKQDAAKAPAKK